MFLDDLQLVPVLGADLVTGNTLLLFLVDDVPAVGLRKGVAGPALHGDVGLMLVVEVYLFVGRHSI